MSRLLRHRSNLVSESVRSRSPRGRRDAHEWHGRGKGKKGTLSRKLPEGVDVKVDGGSVNVVPLLPGRDGSRVQGLAWALLRGMVLALGMATRRRSSW